MTEDRVAADVCEQICARSSADALHPRWHVLLRQAEGREANTPARELADVLGALWETGKS